MGEDDRKGQTAVEYLMTYGWAILIILIVAGVLAYYGIFAPAGFLGPSASGFAQVYVLSPWDFKANGDLTVQIENRVGTGINVTKIYGQVGTTTTSDDVYQVISAGGKSGFITANFSTLSGISGETYQLDLWIEYFTTDPTVLFNSTGTLRGTRS